VVVGALSIMVAVWLARRQREMAEAQSAASQRG
jgi:hypothetical protein